MSSIPSEAEMVLGSQSITYYGVIDPYRVRKWKMKLNSKYLDCIAIERFSFITLKWVLSKKALHNLEKLGEYSPDNIRYCIREYELFLDYEPWKGKVL